MASDANRDLGIKTKVGLVGKGEYGPDIYGAQQAADNRIGAATDAVINSLTRMHVWAIYQSCNIASVWQFPNADILEIAAEPKNQLTDKLKRNLCTSVLFRISNKDKVVSSLPTGGVMHSYQIIHFLQPLDQIMQLAEKFRDSIHRDDARNSISRFVKFSSAEGERRNFQVEVLHVKFVARFEISKYAVDEHDYAAGQYAFFRMVGDKEERVQLAIRLVPPNHLVLPGGTNIEIPMVSDDDEGSLSAHGLRRVKDAISEHLLSDVITNCERWTFG